MVTKVQRWIVISSSIYQSTMLRNIANVSHNKLKVIGPMF